MNEEISQHKPSLKSAESSAQVLLDANKSSPQATLGITEQLNSVSSPLVDLLTSLEEKQKKLEKVKDVLKKYEEEKVPFESFIESAAVNLEEMKPFGLNVEEGEKQCVKLDVRMILTDRNDMI